VGSITCAQHGDGLLPGSWGKWNRFRGKGIAGSGPPEKGKDRQLKPSKGRDNMKKDEGEEPIRTRWRRIGANRVSYHLIVFVFHMSVMQGF
jgi:hypothetical protein